MFSGNFRFQLPLVGNGIVNVFLLLSQFEIGMISHSLKNLIF